MRLLFTFAGGRGHLDPLVPLAYAAQEAGHIVAFVGRPWMQTKVEKLGFDCFNAGTDRGLTPVERPLVAFDIEDERRVVGQAFAGRIARERARDLVALYREWQADIVIWEEIDFGAMVAAEALGIKHVCVTVIASGALVVPSIVAPHLDALRAEYGLAADPELHSLSRYLTLVPFPERFRDPEFPLPAQSFAFRNSTPQQATKHAEWATHPHHAPLVYLTLGTVFPLESGDLFQRMIEGLRKLAIELLVTVGNEIDPSSFGAQPNNVQIEQFIPQQAILPYAEAIVSHAGSGSVIGAISHGLPMVLLPLGADQPLNAQRCEALGLAITLDALTVRPEEIATACQTILQEPSYQQAAKQIQAEYRALPTVSEALAQIERIAQI
jgi:MGT family glycosyltransferase